MSSANERERELCSPPISENCRDRFTLQAYIIMWFSPGALATRFLATCGLLPRVAGPDQASTVQVVGDVYLDVIAKVDDLPTWDGDQDIMQPIETVAGGSALNTAAQLSALLRTRRQRKQSRPFRRCVLHSRVGADLYGDLVRAPTAPARTAPPPPPPRLAAVPHV